MRSNEADAPVHDDPLEWGGVDPQMGGLPDDRFTYMNLLD